ncbi:hypothetical protein Loa_01469 [Legionella oakridgensis ATCC 33761 = DSM 21215]|uniref:Uncharacterized protein n=2 Tax=Legionella oakridgensis TaxID=29423 RepID=W0BE87_9GAMM|nr:hypothetical protein Loa_01469 [Legionella oakridgensis ATCC 33761 = DSM 21215]ETO93309.1 hypothetical protein LOR_79c22870 [Legionella oakridgensis RV-2-2007]KTD37174.1 replication factor C subunit (activator I) [Legionella oakridgensis]STY20119.1 replication factor C subunit (activator I) [Legionella longbeachae]
MSRHQAKKKWREKDIIDELVSQAYTLEILLIAALPKPPNAYKNIHAVVVNKVISLMGQIIAQNLVSQKVRHKAY